MVDNNMEDIGQPEQLSLFAPEEYSLWAREVTRVNHEIKDNSGTSQVRRPITQTAPQKSSDSKVQKAAIIPQRRTRSSRKRLLPLHVSRHFSLHERSRGAQAKTYSGSQKGV